jgi:hypothetical protein
MANDAVASAKASAGQKQAHDSFIHNPVTTKLSLWMSWKRKKNLHDSETPLDSRLFGKG